MAWCRRGGCIAALRGLKKSSAVGCCRHPGPHRPSDASWRLGQGAPTQSTEGPRSAWEESAFVAAERQHRKQAAIQARLPVRR